VGLIVAKVLVADDNKLSRELLKTIVKQQGYEVLEAENGNEVLEILNQHEIDLIFMDYSMPKLSGIETSLQIRQLLSPEKSKVTIIGVSAHGGGIKKECLAAGMNDYISKPINLTDVREKLKNAIKA
jgi:CheY-like chemotaxis protein